MLRAYVDDEAGTLQRALGDPHCLRSWCGKCRWSMRLLAQHRPRALGGEKEKEKARAVEAGAAAGAEAGAPRPVEMAAGIWLHSARYILPVRGTCAACASGATAAVC